MMDASRDVAAVIARLESIVRAGQSQRDPTGYFAALYLAVTRQVETAIDAGRFHDGPRMAQIDVAFAARYFEALDAWRAAEQKPTRTWQIAFVASEDRRATHAQALMLSSVAHIGLDLPIIMAEICGPALCDGPDPELKEDFDTLNDILGALVPKVSNKISRISPILAFFDGLFLFVDEAFVSFSIKAARAKAWKNACALAEQRKSPAALANATADFAQRIMNPSCRCSWSWLWFDASKSEIRSASMRCYLISPEPRRRVGALKGTICAS
ncbi:MAG: DUF5995 family protein [Pseudomonadales bacterium]|nr:DUF5995 family protein [Pseudomonadales bacterium]